MFCVCVYTNKYVFVYVCYICIRMNVTIDNASEYVLF